MTNWHCFQQNGGKAIVTRRTIVGFLLPFFLCLFVFTGCGNSELDDILQKGLNRDVIADLSLEITSLDVNWTKPSADDALGKFTAKMKATETLYIPATNDFGLQKLGIGDLYEVEFNAAKTKFRNLPVSYQNPLQDGMPQEDPSQLRFYDVLVLQGEEVTLTGSVELTKSGNNGWKVRKYLVDPFSCGDRFTPSSKLREEEYRLDNPKTKETVNAIIQSRKKFIGEVDKAEADWAKHRETLIPFVQNTNFLDMWLPHRNNADESAAMKNLTIGEAFDSAWWLSQQRWVAQPGAQIVTLTFTSSQNRVEISFEPNTTTNDVGNATARIPQTKLVFNGDIRDEAWSRIFFNTMYDRLKNNRPDVPSVPPVPRPPDSNKDDMPVIVDVVDYFYSAAAAQYNGDDSSLTMRISTTRTNPNARFTQPKANVVAFPQELNVAKVALANQNRDIEFFISGKENDLRELQRNATGGRWRVSVGFGPHRQNPDGTVTAEALRIELVK